MGNSLALFAVMLAVALLFAGCTSPGTNTYQNATNQPFGQNPDGPMQATGSPQENPFESIVQQPAASNGNVEPDLTKPVPTPPVAGKNVTLALNDIEITYYSVAASYDSLSLGADIYFFAKNNGKETQALGARLASQIPPWCWQFFSFQNETITLAAGEERTLHFYASNDEPGRMDFVFDFWQKPDKSNRKTATVAVYRGSESEEKLAHSAVVQGQVTDKATGKPVPGAKVELNVFSARQSFWATTDAQGNYAVKVIGVDDIASFLGPQPLAYRSLDYFMTIRKTGFEYYYRDGIAPRRGEKTIADAKLSARQGTQAGYGLVWETNVSEPFGFFKVAADRNWEYAIAVQAKHMPELNKPTHFFVFNASTGKQLLAQPTVNECWGLAVAKDAGVAAVSCHNGTVYAISLGKNATVIWNESDPVGGMRREVAVSDDGRYVLTGPETYPGKSYPVVLLDSGNGTIARSILEDYGWIRNAKFSADGSRYVIGASDGVVALFETETGRKLWENRIGEFPFLLELDSQGNTYASGKGRTVFSFFANGSVRWSFRVPDHTALSGALSQDGRQLVFGTGQGWVYCIDASNGSILWRSHISAETLGHNGVSMSSDGSRIAVGGAPQNTLDVMDAYGDIIFSHTAPANNDPVLADKFATIGHAVSESTQKGALGTAMSADGKRILVAYGDDYVREFETK